MAYNKRVNHILANAESLELKVKKLSWGSDYLGGLYDFRIKTNLFGEDAWGVGIDIDEETAFLKAFSESVERAYCKKSDIRSSGVSVHWTVEDAKRNSLNELIERDVFLCHFLTGEGAKRIENPLIQEINGTLSKRSCRVKVYQLSSINEHCIFLTIGENGATGNIVGLGSAVDSETALQKSVTECLFRLVAESGNTVSEQVGVVSSPVDHYNFHLSNSILKDSKLILNSSFSNKVEVFSFNLDVDWNIVGNLGEVVPGLDLYVVKGDAPSLQNMFYGEISENKVNFPRLREFFGKIVEFKDLEKIIHPIG